MAWWVKTEIDDMHGKRIVYETHGFGDSEERLSAAMDKRAKELVAKHNLPEPRPLPWRAPVYDPLHGVGPSSGFRLPFPDRTYQVQIVEEANYLADILPTCLGKAITGFVQ